MLRRSSEDRASPRRHSSWSSSARRRFAASGRVCDGTTETLRYIEEWITISVPGSDCAILQWHTASFLSCTPCSERVGRFYKTKLATTTGGTRSSPHRKSRELPHSLRVREAEVPLQHVGARANCLSAFGVGCHFASRTHELQFA